MTRVHDWEAALMAYLDATAGVPFEWGVADCGLWLAGAVKALTGVDFGEPVRGRYTTALGSVRALSRYGAGTLEQTITAALGEPCHPAFAGRGDAVMADGNAGLCMGGHALFLSDIGTVSVDRSEWSTAWKVG